MLYNGDNSGSKAFGYSYDALNRLTNAASTSALLDEAINYDKMGNITALTRSGANAATLAYTYANSNSSNQLASVTNSGSAYRTYTYDGNGNATSDGGNKSISYNMLNLPQAVTQSSATLATYTYEASGAKLRNTGSDGTWDYVSGIVYHNNAIDFIQTEEGRALNNSGSYTYQYNLKDHLGNDRVSMDASGVLQEDEYYSFGLRHGIYDNSNNNRYLYNGKEIQTDLANQYDYGARFYDPVIGRWTSVDPKVEDDQESTSPYGYVYDDPIKFMDPDGQKGVKPIVMAAGTVGGLAGGIMAGSLVAGGATFAGFSSTGIGIPAGVVVGGGIVVGGAIAAGAVWLWDKATSRNSESTEPTLSPESAAPEKKARGSNNEKTQSAAKTGQEAHRQEEKKLEEQGAKTEQTMTLKDGTVVRKDAVMPDGTAIIIKPNTTTGKKSAAKREEKMKNNGVPAQTILYDPLNPAYQPYSPSYIGPKKSN